MGRLRALLHTQQATQQTAQQAQHPTLLRVASPRECDTQQSNAVPLAPLPNDERAALDRLAAAWGMDAEDRAVMYRQCAEGGELADGSWLSPEAARVFWLAEAGAIH